MTAMPVVPYAGWPVMTAPRPKPDLPFSLVIAAAVALAPIAVLSSGGCPGHGGPEFGQLPTITSDDPQAEAELREARELDERGDAAAAEARYRAFLERRKADPLAPIAELALGKLLLRAGKHGDAKAHFDRVSQHPDSALAEQGRFYGAIASQRMGDHATAANVLQPMIGRPIDPADTALLLRTLADAYGGLARHGDAITVLDTLGAAALPETDRAYAQARIEELVRDKASVDDIKRLYRDLPRDGLAWKHVIRRAARDADAAGDTERARELLEVMREEGLPIDETLASIAVRAERPTEANPQVVGAVLSLSGRGRRVGELALRGAMLAASLPPAGPPESNAPQLVFRDDGGDPERAIGAVEELVTVHRAVAIIGPMDTRAAAAAAARAEQLGVPIVLLAPAGDDAASGKTTYRMFPSVTDEIRALVGRARAQGHRRVAALLPEGAYGDLMEQTLRAEAALAGAQVTTVQRYAPQTTSFVEVAQSLAKQPFEALLLSDVPQRIALIAPSLAAAGLWSSPSAERPPPQSRPIAVLAPAVAFDPTLLRGVSRYLQGALFSVPFDPQVESGAGRSFVERFTAQFGEAPDAFAALAHDAYKLVRAAVDGGAKTRKALAEALPRTRSAELAGPAPNPSQPGRALRATRLLQLRGDAFVDPDTRDAPLTP
jgi:branched-chain amino acid transport system substrate-binding protein